MLFLRTKGCMTFLSMVKLVNLTSDILETLESALEQIRDLYEDFQGEE